MRLTVNLPAGLGEEIITIAKQVYGDTPDAVDQLVAASLIPALHQKGLLKFKPNGGQDLTISEIPGWLMTEFVSAANRLRPEAGDQGWMHVLLDTMISFVDADKAVFMLTDIPRNDVIAFEAMLEQIGLVDEDGKPTLEGFIGQMFIEAGQGTLLTSLMTGDNPDPTRNYTIIIRNVEPRSLATIHELAKRLNAAMPKEMQVPEVEIAPHHFLAMQLGLFAQDDANAFIKVEHHAAIQKAARRTSAVKGGATRRATGANGDGKGEQPSA